jgi:type II secretory pathway pseudopilin PulG
LIELMVVILIITVCAGLAIPSAVVQLRDRRVQEAARKIGLMYRQARLRAEGRGAAVLVRFASGQFTVLEARLGTAPAGAPAACADLPVSSCTNTAWDSNPAVSRLVDGYGGAASGDIANITVALSNSAGANVSSLEICFTPMGRAFTRTVLNDGTPFTTLGAAFLATLTRPGIGRARRVALLPNGTARLSAQ